MNQIISVCMTEDQIHAMHTDQMVKAVNQNHRDAEIRRKDRAYRRYIHHQDRRAKHAAWMHRVHKAAMFALISVACTATALAGLSWAPLFVPLGIACGMYAAGIVGGLLRERQMV
jgi:hypothetical protein